MEFCKFCQFCLKICFRVHGSLGGAGGALGAAPPFQFLEFLLLVGGKDISYLQEVFELQVLDLGLHGKKLVKLGNDLLISRRDRLYELGQDFLLGTDLPLQIGETGHGLNHFLPDGGLLSGGEIDRLLVAHDEFRREEFPHKITARGFLAGARRAGAEIGRRGGGLGEGERGRGEREGGEEGFHSCFCDAGVDVEFSKRVSVGAVS